MQWNYIQNFTAFLTILTYNSNEEIYFFAAIACALSLSSCSSLSGGYTATTVPVATSMTSASVANLEVSLVRTSYRYNPTAAVKSAGKDNCLAAVVQAFLRNNGNADVIVAPEYHWEGGFKMVEVTGYPTKYKNFRSVN